MGCINLLLCPYVILANKHPYQGMNDVIQRILQIGSVGIWICQHRGQVQLQCLLDSFHSFFGFKVRGLFIEFMLKRISLMIERCVVFFQKFCSEVFRYFNHLLSLVLVLKMRSCKLLFDIFSNHYLTMLLLFITLELSDCRNRGAP